MICSTLKPVLKECVLDGPCAFHSAAMQVTLQRVQTTAKKRWPAYAATRHTDLGTDLSQSGSIGAECRPTDIESQDVVVRNRYVLQLLLF